MSSCGVLGRVLHRHHARRLLAGGHLEHGLEDARRDVARQQLAQYFGRVGLEDELVARDALVGVARRLDRQQPVDDGRWVSVEMKRG